MTLLEPGAVAPPTDDQIQEILVWLSARPRSTGEIARKFCLTPAQVRAGLEPLRAQGALRRTAGGAWEEVEGADGTPSQISISDLEDPPDPSSDSTPIPSNPPPIPLDSPAAPAQEPPMPAARLAPSDQRILDLVRARPGVAQAAVAELTGISGGTVAGCVRLLEGRGLIERRREAPTERPGYLGLALYPAGAPASPTPPAPPPKKAAEVRRDTLALIRAEPGILQARVGQRIGVNQSATSKALRELEAEGLIRREEIEIPQEGGGGTHSLALFPASDPPPALAPEPIPETRPPLVRVRVPPLPALPEGEEPGGDCDGSDPEERVVAGTGSELPHMRTALDAHKILEAAKVPHGPLPERVGLLAERAEDLERQLREQSDDLAACGRALGCEDPTEGREVVRRAEAAARVREELGVALRERTQERDAARAALGLAPGASLLDAIRSLREAGPPEPRWVETAEGSWDLRVLRPVSVAEVDRVESGFEWICGEESGTARTLERAQRRAEQALADGEGA